jgi:hypothetical protein
VQYKLTWIGPIPANAFDFASFDTENAARLAAKQSYNNVRFESDWHKSHEQEHSQSEYKIGTTPQLDGTWREVAMITRRSPPA